MSFVLRVTGPKGSEERVLSDKNLPLVLGRGSEADWIVDDDKCSRKHLCVEKRGSDIWIVDLESSNGTFDGQEARVHQRRIVAGDEFRAGRHQIKFDLPNALSSLSAATKPFRSLTGSRAKASEPSRRAQTAVFLLSIAFWILALGVLPSGGDQLNLVIATFGFALSGLIPLLLVALVSRIAEGEWDFWSPAKVLLVWTLWYLGLATIQGAVAFFYGQEHVWVWAITTLSGMISAILYGYFVFAPWPRLLRQRRALIALGMLVMAIGASWPGLRHRFRLVDQPQLSLLVASNTLLERKPATQSSDLVEELKAQIQNPQK
jgi:hypothetical protein